MALGVSSVAVEVDEDVVYVRVPRGEREKGETLTFEQALALVPNMPKGTLLLGVNEQGD
jgi:hypothetical protein